MEHITESKNTPGPQALVTHLIDLLTVRKSDQDRYTGIPKKGGVGRVFGGQVVAQALQAAQASITDGKQAHSLHAYFLRGGEEGPPIDYTIARDFDGRSFANRRVVASQNGTPILNLTTSFQTPEEGLQHDEYAMPDVPPPEDLLSDMEHRRKFLETQDNVSERQRAAMLRPRPIEMRTSDKLHWMNAKPRAPFSHVWFRTVAPVPDRADNPAIHRAIIAYASDYTLLGTSALPHGLSWARGEISGASLDHAIWFHRPARADEWLLYATDSPWTGSGRGFNRGQIFNQSGELVASITQEGVIRRRRKG